ncbi:hypothetical protein LTR36_005607 [Oleoguttula mirabilis]|uniref:Uncharacterized protein n=1 Tax=Oleoguttula mirabilis TaxID=1507867 RepID=A0AAV9JFC4_9PEZI|nr:hypothetical protein LTR36_005607 [Oleoguttula mirabilis]
MSAGVDKNGHSSSDSFVSAPEANQAATRTARMEAAPGQMSAAVNSLVEDFQEQLNELKEGQTALLKAVDVVKGEQHTMQVAIGAVEEKVNEAQLRQEAAMNATGATDEAVDDWRTERRQLQCAVDAILEQHNSLSAKIHDLSRPQSAAAAHAPVVAPEIDTITVKPLESAQRPRRPKPVAQISRRRQDSAGENDSHAFQSAIEMANANLGVPQHGPMPSAFERAEPLDYSAIVTGGLESSLMLPPRPRYEREASVASTVTLCGDQHATRPVMPMRPPPRAASFDLLVAPLSRSKRKLAGGSREGSTVSLAEGGRKKKRATAPNTPGDGVQLGDRLLTSTETETTHLADVDQVDGSANGDEIEVATTQAAETHTPYDDDEIVVATRRPASKTVQQSNTTDAAQSPSAASTDHAALVDELLDFVDASEESMMQGPPPPPKTAKAVGLAELFKQFGVRSDGKDKAAAVPTEGTSDTIAFGAPRRSARAPQPVKRLPTE